MRRLKTLIWKLKAALADNNKYVELLRAKGLKAGKNCVIDKRAEFGTESYLIELGDNVRITQGVKFITHDGGMWVPRNMGLVDKNADLMGKIVVGSNVNIGWNAIIMPRVKIGDNCIIGAGAVVTKDIPSGYVAVGVPAKPIETIEEYVKKNASRMLVIKNLPYEEKRKAVLEALNK